jgi:VCBS repeat-containing protein
VVTVTIAGANDAPVISGPTTGTVTEDSALTATGTLSITDADAGQSVFAAQTATAGTYGSFAVTTAGAWTYTLNNADTAVQALNAGQTLTEHFSVASSDGSVSESVNVTINGTTDAVASILLADVALGVGGFKIIGENANDFAGQGAASAGDVNGDGYDDVIVGGNLNDAGGTDAGAAYVVYGGPNAALVNGVVNLDAVATGTGGFKIIGQSANQGAGFHVSSAGDVNNDGYADVLVTAQNGNAVYVVYGGSNAALVNGVIDLDLVAAGQGGFKIVGEGGSDAPGSSLAPAGDVNGDGYDDFILGAVGNAAGGGAYAGAAYVIYGGPNSAPAGGVLDLHTIAAGTAGFKIIGENTADLAGCSVGSAGDINQDGYDDLIVGAYKNTSNGTLSGAAYVVYGGPNAALVNGVINLDTIATGVGGFKIVAQGANDAVGTGVASAGDVNGDGINDLVVGAYGDDTHGAYAGAAYVVYGGSNPALSGGTLNLATIAIGTGGFKIIAEAAADNTGFSASSAGDVNGDGYADVLIAAGGNDAGGSNAGAAYVVYGGVNSAIVNGVVDLAVVANGSGGFKVIGEAANDLAGGSVSAAGDINGDGYDDIIIGAKGEDTGGGSAGAAYVIYGGYDLGGQSGLTLTGTSGVDTLTGKAGNDILTGGDGADILTGGLGADIFHYTAISQGGDTIKDFTKGEDLVGLLNSILGETGTGTLNFDGTFGSGSNVLFESVAGASTAAQHNSAKLIFDTSGHDLYYDNDGGASSSGRILLAHLDQAGMMEATSIKLMAG